MDQLLNSLAANGPWAIMAGWLLTRVIKAWTDDRNQLVNLLTEFKDALMSLKGAVEELKSEIKSKE
ncbi:MAG: hypothetical protein KF824_13535 [Fimbriimonadaceae bacterium]|nr:hypothetical protein [Fimbriimonadaceae bacterium]QYK53262.1 MAG: hypothetical protein KF824_13535 [Fimbriimonadaceae bacterium]